jgi:PQQ-like domain
MINANNAKSLAGKWTTQVHGDVSANPAVVGGSVYVPNWGGYLNKIDAATGHVIWSRPISDYTGVAGSVSRAAPAVVGNTVYLGDQNGGHLFAVDATSGDPVWTTRLDDKPIDHDHPLAILTAGPLVVNGVVYQGIAPAEEGQAADPTYPCCSFRGAIAAVRASTGEILWKTYTIPDNGGVPGGYGGGAVWGTTPAYDAASNTLFVTTGNNYTVPQSVKDCEAAGGSASDCLSPDDHIDAIMALNATTGAIKWATGVQGFDDWNVAAFPASRPTIAPPTPGLISTSAPGPTCSRSRTETAASDSSSEQARRAGSTGRSTPRPGRSFGAPRPGRARPWAESNRGPRLTEGASTSPRRTSTASSTPSRRARRSPLARGRRSTRPPGGSTGRFRTRHTTPSAVATPLVRSPSRTGCSTRPR